MEATHQAGVRVPHRPGHPDGFVPSKGCGDYFALSFVLLKDKTFYNPNRGKRVKVIDVLNYKVPTIPEVGFGCVSRN